MNVLVLQGPNLNLLGEREPHIYGTMTLEQLHRHIRNHARALGIRVRLHQTNHASQLLDWMAEYRPWMNALMINPGALTHYFWPLREAAAALKVPVYEVHLSHVFKREPFRRVSVLKSIRTALVHGKGPESYLEALTRIKEA